MVLSRIGYPGGPDEAQTLAALQSLAQTPHEAAALEAISAARTRGPIPESLCLACAHLLVERGDRPAALLLLSTSSSIPALLLRADLEHDAGEVARAVCLVERVLARDYDAPGARERHDRWFRELSGAAPRPAPSSRDATIAVPTAQQSAFRIEREVARGGAGTVYLAYDEQLGRPVALKVYHRPREDAAQIQREAATAARFAGRRVVRVYDANFEQGWIAFEWIEPGSIRELIQHAQVNLLAPLSSWVRPLAESLAILHGEGIVHADIKPANVLVRGRGHPVLSDFGIAAPAGSPSLGGSTGFLSPERLAGRPIDPSDDIYGFGRILEELIPHLPPNDETRWFAKLAEHCMTSAGSRPADAFALLDVLARGPQST